MTENFTFEQLFAAYKSSYCNKLMTEEQNGNLRIWHERRGKKEITLSQLDFWMINAGLIKKKVLTVYETGKTFSKLKKFSLNEQEFQEYLEMLSNDKGFDIDEVKEKLLSAGLPTNSEVLIDLKAEESS